MSLPTPEINFLAAAADLGKLTLQPCKLLCPESMAENYRILNASERSSFLATPGLLVKMFKDVQRDHENTGLYRWASKATSVFLDGASFVPDFEFMEVCGLRHCLTSSRDLREFVDITGAPVATTVVGRGVVPLSDDRCS